MSSRQQRPVRKTHLTFRMIAALGVASVFLSMLIAFLGADQAFQRRVSNRHEASETLAASLAQRSTTLVELGDDLRLSVLATAAADVAQARILFLDRDGLVRVDTGLDEGGLTVPLLAREGPFRRLRDDGVHEAVAPVRGASGDVGEVRVRYAEPVRSGLDFAWSLFASAFVVSLSLVAIAGLFAAQWMARIDEAAAAARQLARGEFRAQCRRPAAGAVRELQDALRELGASLEQGFVHVEQGVVGLAEQVVAMLEHRGHVPPGHGERAARYAGILAARLNLLPEDRRELELAARLHDVGKAGVRMSALGQRGVLTDDERASMREHPVRGARFLASVPSLARVAEAIRHHHEKYDGSGHPDGLRGDRIPLGARILAIADAYDLATSISPDGEPVPWPEALDRLREDRGTHFDPWLLDLFEAEIRSNPVPSRPLRPVMISTAGVMPYQATDDALRAFGVDGDLGESATLLDEEIEVLLDDGGVEPS